MIYSRDLFSLFRFFVAVALVVGACGPAFAQAPDESSDQSADQFISDFLDQDSLPVEGDVAANPGEGDSLADEFLLPEVPQAPQSPVSGDDVLIPQPEVAASPESDVDFLVPDIDSIPEVPSAPAVPMAQIPSGPSVPPPGVVPVSSEDDVSEPASPQPAVEENIVQTVDVEPPPVQEDFLVPSIPAIPDAPDPDEGLFFDSESLVPEAQMSVKGGPRKVSPRLEPASKFVVVKKDHGGTSRKAEMVSAERALKLGRYDSALQLYDELYRKNRRDPVVLMGRAMAFQRLGRDDAAVAAYEEFLDVRPDNVEARVNMLGIMGQRYPAVALQRLMGLHQGHMDNVSILAQMSVIQANIGRYDDALKNLGVAASIEPKNAGHLFNMAVIADRAGQAGVAVQYYEQALEVDAIHGGSRSIPRDAVFSRLAQLR